MKLKHPWKDSQAVLICCLKKFLASQPEFVLSAKTLINMQQIIMKLFEKYGRKVDFAESWEYFGLSGFSQSSDSDSGVQIHNFWYTVFCQSAAVVFAGDSENVWRNSEIIEEINCFFKERILIPVLPKLPEQLRSLYGEKLYDETVSKKRPSEIVKYCRQAEFPQSAWRHVCNRLLNDKDYTTLMAIADDPQCPLFENYFSVLELHFLNPEKSSAKEKFNRSYIKRFGVSEPEIWQKHHEVSNLEYVLKPLLENGCSPRWDILSKGALHVTLHDFCCFLDEVSFELEALQYSGLPCGELTDILTDIRCAKIYCADCQH